MTRFDVALIDGDVLLYAVARGCEREENFDTSTHILYSDVNEAWDNMRHQIDNIKEVVDAAEVTVHISGSANWRKSVLPSYKAHRKDVRKPLCFAALKDRLREEYPCVTREGLEADDTLGICSGPGKVIVSLDKDFFTIQGHFARISLDRSVEIHEVSATQARYYHMLQAFMGDRTDGYPGCPGVGEITARRKLDALVSEAGHLRSDEWLNVWMAVCTAYVKAGMEEQDAQENFCVSKILDGRSGYVEGDTVVIRFPDGTHRKVSL